MNVYVRSLAGALSAGRRRVRRAHPCRGRDASRRSSRSSPASASCTSPAGPPAPIAKQRLPALVDEFAADARASPRALGAGTTRCTRNYWVSGAVGHQLKHELDLPLVTTFHTLARVEGRGRRRRRPCRASARRGRGRARAPIGSSRRRDRRERRQLVLPLRRRSRPRRGRPARRRPHRVLPRRPARGAAVRSACTSTARCCCSSGASSRSRASTSRSRALAELHDPSRDARRRGRPERARRGGRGRDGCTRWSTSSG